MGPENPQTKRFLVQFKKCVQCGQLILRKISKIWCHQMSDSKAKMHQIQFTALPQTSDLYLMGPTSKGRRKATGKEGEGRVGRGKGTGKEGEGKKGS